MIIGIVGLGLIGGSLGLDLKKQGDMMFWESVAAIQLLKEQFLWVLFPKRRLI